MKTAEEILKRSAFDQYNSFFKISLDDMNWFVEQAEKVEQLERDKKALANIISADIKNKEKSYSDGTDYKRI